MAEQITLEKLQEMAGRELGVSEWMEIKQDRINAFAECTEDRQWIHVNPEMAKQGPFGTTIAHGYLVLSLLSWANFQLNVFPPGIKMAINYGLNKVRFTNAVPVGSKIRFRVVFKAAEEKGEGRILITTENTAEIEGQEKPAMVAESLGMLFV